MFFPVFIIDISYGTQLVQSPLSGTFEIIFKEKLVKSMYILLKYLFGILQRHSGNCSSQITSFRKASSNSRWQHLLGSEHTRLSGSICNIWIDDQTSGLIQLCLVWTVLRKSSLRIGVGVMRVQKRLLTVDGLLNVENLALRNIYRTLSSAELLE